jgi:Domain of unknown function (DUF1996)
VPGSRRTDNDPRRWVARAVAVFGMLLAVSASAATATSGYSASSLTQAVAAGFPGGPHFVLRCRFTHRNNDDAIVFPGEPGRSHNHSYVGNFSVDASTQPGALLGGRTSCDFDADSSAYWAPTLFVGRRSVLPLAGFAYYVKRTSSDVVAHPPGLKMIAGNAAALRPQSTNIAAWSCGELGGGRKFATIPACARNHLLQVQITFPNCWQGTSLDSPNHKLHLAYASAGRCPASHPIALPTVVLILLYPEVPAQAQVASGRFGIHADFMNGWNQEVLVGLVTALNREP